MRLQKFIKQDSIETTVVKEEINEENKEEDALEKREAKINMSPIMDTLNVSKTMKPKNRRSSIISNGLQSDDSA